MATASELDKIRSNPIKEGVGAFRRLFESTRSDLGVALSSDTVQIVFSTVATAGMAQILRITFLTNIRSCQKSGDLGILYGRLDLNLLDSASAIPLVEQIVRN